MVPLDQGKAALAMFESFLHADKPLAPAPRMPVPVPGISVA